MMMGSTICALKIMQFRLNIALKIVHATPLYRWVGKKETLQRIFCSVFWGEFL